MTRGPPCPLHGPLVGPVLTVAHLGSRLRAVGLGFWGLQFGASGSSTIHGIGKVAYLEAKCFGA